MAGRKLEGAGPVGVAGVAGGGEPGNGLGAAGCREEGTEYVGGEKLPGSFSDRMGRALVGGGCGPVGGAFSGACWEAAGKVAGAVEGGTAEVGGAGRGDWKTAGDFSKLGSGGTGSCFSAREAGAVPEGAVVFKSPENGWVARAEAVSGLMGGEASSTGVGAAAVPGAVVFESVRVASAADSSAAIFQMSSGFGGSGAV